MFACSIFFFSSRRRHTRFDCDWSSDVCSSDLNNPLSATYRSCIGPVNYSGGKAGGTIRSEEHTSELQSQSNLVCRLLLEKKKKYSKLKFMYLIYISSICLIYCWSFITRIMRYV